MFVNKLIRKIDIIITFALLFTFIFLITSCSENELKPLINNKGAISKVRIDKKENLKRQKNPLYQKSTPEIPSNKDPQTIRMKEINNE